MNHESKKKIIDGFAQLTANHALNIFKGLELKVGFSATIEDTETEKVYYISFGESEKRKAQMAIVNRLSALSQEDLDEVYCFINTKTSLPPY